MDADSSTTKGDTTSTRVTSLETAPKDDMDDVVADAMEAAAGACLLLPPPGIETKWEKGKREKQKMKRPIGKYGIPKLKEGLRKAPPGSGSGSGSG